MQWTYYTQHIQGKVEHVHSYILHQLFHQSCFYPVLFLWWYEPVRRTGKYDDWLTIFFARIIRFIVQKFQLFGVIFCIIIFFIELWHILILWLVKMPNGGMPVFTLIATGWRYRIIFFYKKSTAFICADPQGMFYYTERT